MVQTWVWDRWYDHNCGENHGVNCEPAAYRLWLGPLWIHDTSPISLKHANMALTMCFSERNQEIGKEHTFK